MLQRGEHTVSRPALLADRLLLATEEIRQAGAIDQTLDGRQSHMTADIPRWIRDRVEAASCQLREAFCDTVDPAEQDRIAGLRASTQALCAVLEERRSSVRPRLEELRQAVSGMADDVEQRVRNKEPEPSWRPPLGTSLDRRSETWSKTKLSLE